jgi:hypothetical protein
MLIFCFCYFSLDLRNSINLTLTLTKCIVSVVEFQQENGWAADYEHVVDLDEETEEEEEEPSTVSTYVITKIED